MTKQKIDINFETTPILYTDQINISTNKSGVVLNVIQKLGITKQARIVARVGMSREHAREFVEKLGSLLIMTENRNTDKNLN